MFPAFNHESIYKKSSRRRISARHESQAMTEQKQHKTKPSTEKREP
jgi:hypothetical protein